MKMKVKILKDVQSYEKGKVYRIAPSFARKLVRIGKAEIVEVPPAKELKTDVETKEEKFIDTVVETKIPEVRDFSDFSISKLRDMVGEFTLQDLADLLKDTRVGAIRVAQEEIRRREG